MAIIEQLIDAYHQCVDESTRQVLNRIQYPMDANLCRSINSSYGCYVNWDKAAAIEALRIVEVDRLSRPDRIFPCKKRRHQQRRRNAHLVSSFSTLFK